MMKSSANENEFVPTSQWPDHSIETHPGQLRGGSFCNLNSALAKRLGSTSPVKLILAIGWPVRETRKAIMQLIDIHVTTDPKRYGIV